MMRILKAALSGFWDGLRTPMSEEHDLKRDMAKRNVQLEAENRRKARVEAAAYQSALRGRASR